MAHDSLNHDPPVSASSELGLQACGLSPSSTIFFEGWRAMSNQCFLCVTWCHWPQFVHLFDGIRAPPQGAAVGSIKEQTGSAQRGFIASYLCFLLHSCAFKLDPFTPVFPWQDFRAKMHGIYGHSEARPPTDTSPSPSLPWTLVSQVSTYISWESIQDKGKKPGEWMDS